MHTSKEMFGFRQSGMIPLPVIQIISYSFQKNYRFRQKSDPFSGGFGKETEENRLNY